MHEEPEGVIGRGGSGGQAEPCSEGDRAGLINHFVERPTKKGVIAIGRGRCVVGEWAAEATGRSLVAVTVGNAVAPTAG